MDLNRYKRRKSYRPVMILAMIFCCLCFIYPLRVSAQGDPVSAFEEALAAAKKQVDATVAGLPGAQAKALCASLTTAAKAIPCTIYDCRAKLNALSDVGTVCNKYISDNATEQQIKADLDVEIRKVKREQAARKFLEAISKAATMAVDTALRTMTRETVKLAFTALQGQKPAYITEGWEAYLTNAGDAALGDFVDRLSQSYGVDICASNLQVKLLINAQVNQTNRRVRCTFTQIMSNWQEAVTNPDFPLEYSFALRPGENDLTASLMALDFRDAYVNQKLKAKTYEASTNQGWLSKVTFNGQILTPGTLFREKVFKDIVDTPSGKATQLTWMGTIYSVVEEFGNSVAAESLGLLKQGFFAAKSSITGGGSSGSGSGDNQNNALLGQGANMVSGILTALFNPSASPVITEGAAGAEERANKAISGNRGEQGGKVDLLVKLSTCTDEAKTNPGPTDCVIDSALSQAIKSNTYVIDLPDQIKNRVFSPRSEQSNSLQTAIPYRSILILRQNRIVPVGWEEAANFIKNSTIDREYTLGEILNCYNGKDEKSGCPSDNFKGMIDPYWVLKVYETSCRRQGYGALNINKDDQTGAVGREEYCSDQQQCLQEDENGNCLAYGYCSEERRTWNLGKTCLARNNTCQTYTSRGGATASYLTNTLDFRDCNSQVAGCRWYATNYNPASNVWTNLGAGTQLTPPEAINQTITVPLTEKDWWVQEGHQVSRNHRLRLATVCSQSMCLKDSTGKGCDFRVLPDGKYCVFQYSEASGPTAYVAVSPSCAVPDNGVSCQLQLCNDPKLPGAYSGSNTNLPNLGLETPLLPVAGYSAEEFKAASWTMAFIDSSNRHLRDSAAAHTGGYSLAVKTLYAVDNLISYETAIPVEKNKNYNLKFYYKGTVNGSVYVEVRSGKTATGAINFDQDSTQWPEYLNGVQLTNGSVNWREANFNFSSGDNDQVILVVRNPANMYADLSLDDFEFYPISTACGNNAVSVYVTSREAASEMYFDRNAQTCSAASDGCSQFIRTKSNLGSNMIVNGGFDGNLYDWNNLSLSSDNKAQINNAPAVLAYDNANKEVEVSPNQYYFIALDGYQINESAPVEIEAIMKFKAAKGNSPYLTIATTSATCVSVDSVTTASKTLGLKFTPSAVTSRYFCKFKTPDTATRMNLWLVTTATGASALVDNVKLEAISFNATYPSAYSDYNPSTRPNEQVSYLKKAPDYYSCYDAHPETVGTQWPENQLELSNVLKDRNASCSRYSGVCTPQEVGCELYKPMNGDPSIPGVAQDFDACPKACAGYQLYKQEQTNFVNEKFQQFIADNKLKTCSAAYAGCDEFTNLDGIGQGAEQKEYFSKIQACQKPATDDAAYYTWIGSDITGFQLVAFNLKKSTTTDKEFVPDSKTARVGGNAPCTNLYYDVNGNAKCGDPEDAASLMPEVISGAKSVTDYGICTRDDMVSNPDCREFYDTSGNIHYRLLSHTVSVSENCHPYRRTMTQTSFGDAKTDCQSHSGWWKEASNECIYMAIPGQGKSCPASAKGCRAYTGNRGNNVRNAISVINFTAGTSSLDLWEDKDSGKDGLFFSSESTFPGGNSLSNKTTNNVIRYPITIKKGKAYSLSFWAKGNAAYYLDNIKFTTNNVEDNYFSAKRLVGDNPINPATQMTEDWKRYELGPVFVTWEPGDGNYLQFTIPSGQVIYLDNVILKEITNQVYAIENSWFTPVACDNKLDDPDGAKAKAEGNCQDEKSGRCYIGEMLGCAGYTDRQNKAVYLKSFASLCRTEAVGCEALIDTFNSSAHQAQSFNLTNTANYDNVFVATDTLVYIVNDSKYSCAKGDKGCTRYGLPLIDKWDEITGYNNVYIKNDPDRYNTDLCSAENLWCEEWAGNNTLSYFKDPHGKICQFQSADGANGAAKWFKSGTSEQCSVSYQQSFGWGYKPATDKLQPIGPTDSITLKDPEGANYSGWVGACSNNDSGCAEYVDPLDDLGTNIFPQRCDGAVKCEVSVKKNTLYVLTDNVKVSSTPDGRDWIRCRENIQSSYQFYSDANVYAKENYYLGRYLYLAFADNTSPTCLVTFIKNDGTSFNLVKDKVALAGVYYALSSSVSGSECNGQVDFKQGCVLFNNRSNVDYSTTTDLSRVTSSLVFSSRLTRDANRPFGGLSTPVSPVTGAINDLTKPRDSNIILKTKPNRACASWLTCTTFEKKKEGESSALAPYLFSDQDTCLEIGSCTSLAENGTCNNYIIEPTTASSYSPGTDANKSGFSRIGYYPYSSMQQLGQASNIVNGSFEETYGATSQPLGWQLADYYCKSPGYCSDGYPALSYKDWQSSYMTVARSTGKAHDGTGYLQVNSGWGTISEFMDLSPNQDYYISAWVNTMDLQGPGDGINLPRAEMRLRFYDKTNTSIVNAVTPIDEKGNPIGGELYDGDNWLKLNSMQAAKGQGWQQIVTHLRTGNKVAAMTVALFNFNPDGTKVVDNSKLGGYSSWDNIDVKPLLKACDTSVDGSSCTINRTCRVYPAMDAPACKYTDGTNYFYGQYGYCMTPDPANAQQCLQWWPVDSLRGETMSDFSSYYAERYPLYYCLEKKTKDLNFNKFIGQFGVFGKQTQNLSGLNNLQLNAKGNQIEVFQFKVDPAWTPLFRYPFVYRFDLLEGVFGRGDTASAKPILGEINATMWPRKSCAGLLHLIGINIDNVDCWASGKDTSLAAGDDAKPVEGTPWGEVWDYIKNVTLITTIIDFIGNIPGYFAFNDEDYWGGFGGIAWYLDVDIAGIQIIVVPWKSMPWHTALAMNTGFSVNTLVEIISVVIKVGGWASSDIVKLAENSVATFGYKIITDEDQTYGKELIDPVPGIPGDILGYAKFMNFKYSTGDKAGGLAIFGNFSAKTRVEYCTKMVQVVNSGGETKAWATRLSPGSQYINAMGQDCVVDSLADEKNPNDSTQNSNTNPGGRTLPANNCFYSSQYCLEEFNGPKNLCDNYVGDSGVIDPDDPNRVLICEKRAPLYQTNKLNCAQAMSDSSASKDTDFWQAHSYPAGTNPALAGFDACVVNYKYFCYDHRGAQRIYRRIYAANGYAYNTDYRPYGSVVAPNTGQFPNEWDTRPDSTGNQPLFYEFPNAAGTAQARMGQVNNQSNYSIDSSTVKKPDLLQLFGRTYSYWEWEASGGEGDMSGITGAYKLKANPADLTWSLPTQYCSNNIRPGNPYTSFCLVKPTFTMAKVDPTVINSTGAVKVGFGVKLDPDQVPIRSYEIDWGDGNVSSYAGLSLADRPNNTNTFDLYHFYNYDQVHGRLPERPQPVDVASGSYCEGPDSAGQANACHILIKVTVRDNWAAENLVLIKDLVVLPYDSYEAEFKKCQEKCTATSFDSKCGQECPSGNQADTKNCCDSSCHFKTQTDVNTTYCCANVWGGYRACNIANDGYCDLTELSDESNPDCQNISQGTPGTDIPDGICPEGMNINEDIDCDIVDGSIISIKHDASDFEKYLNTDTNGGGCGGSEGGQGNLNFDGNADSTETPFSNSERFRVEDDPNWVPGSCSDQVCYGDIIRLSSCYGSTNGTCDKTTPIKLTRYDAENNAFGLTNPERTFLDLCGVSAGNNQTDYGASGDTSIYFRVCSTPNCNDQVGQIPVRIGQGRIFFRAMVKDSAGGFHEIPLFNRVCTGDLFECGIDGESYERRQVSPFSYLSPDDAYFDSSVVQSYHAAMLVKDPSVNLLICNNIGNCGAW